MRSFAIVTVAANDVVRTVHDRMPLCVAPGSFASWLDPSVSGADALAALRVSPPGLSYYEADAQGNDVRREGPECIAPVRASSQLGLFNH